MEPSRTNLSKPVSVTVPETCRDFFAHLCKTKNLSPDQAAELMVYFSCRMLEESPLNQGTDLYFELGFAKGLRDKTLERLDALSSVGEKALIESLAITRALLERAAGDSA